MGNLIVKSNAFVGASYGLKTTEQRLLLLAILKARETNNVQEAIGKTLTIHASDYMTHFGVDRATAYESLENAVNGLFETEYRYIELLPNNIQKTHRHRFTDYVAYSDGLGQVEIRFTAETVPLVVGLSENFTKYEIEQVAKLSSQYALRLYEILSQWRAKGQCTLDLAELRFKFSLLDDEYLRMHDFKKRVLDYAIAEINEHTDLTANYEQHKRGRVITGFTFTIKQKQVAKPKDNERDPKTVDMFSGFTDIERQTIQQRIDEHIERLETKGEMVGEYWRENITKKAIAERWGLDVLAEQQRKEQEYKTRLAIEQAEMQAKARAEQEKAEQAENRKKLMIAKFESLPHNEQEQVLNQIGEILSGGVFADFFKRAREQGTAHKDVMFMSWFFKILEV